MKFTHIFLIALLLGGGISASLGLDAHYEKKLLEEFLKTQGFTDISVLESRVSRSLFWIQRSEWKLIGNWK